MERCLNGEVLMKEAGPGEVLIKEEVKGTKGLKHLGYQFKEEVTGLLGNDRINWQ